MPVCDCKSSSVPSASPRVKMMCRKIPHIVHSSLYEGHEVIFVSGHEHYARHTVGSGALGFLVKPIDMDELISLIKSAEASLIFAIISRHCGCFPA